MNRNPPAAHRASSLARARATGARAWPLLVLVLLSAVVRAEEPAIPKPRGFVNDFAGVIDRGTVDRLTAVIGELQAKTGAEIAVVTVDSTKPLSAFDYAMKIAEAWKPGAAGKDNGVVFLVAVKDREMFILTGYGVEGALPDGKVGAIRDRIAVPSFRRGDYAGGIRTATEEIAAIIAREHGVTLTGVPTPRRVAARRDEIPLLPLLIIVVIVIVLWRTGLWPLLSMPRRRGGFGGGFGGGGFGGGGGGFGGFGGGGFGGGGAGGKW